MKLVVFILLITGYSARAAVFAVPSVYATVQAAHDHASFNSGADVIHINAAAYSGNERVNWTKDGSYPNYNTIISTNGKAIMQGFAISSGLNLKFINIDFTHTTTTYPNAFAVSGTSSNIHIIDCIMRDIHTEAAHFTTADFIYIHGCVVNYVAHPGSIQLPDNGFSSDLQSEYMLIQFTEMHRCGDFITTYGPFKRFRNIWMEDTDPEIYWTDIDTHTDMFQVGSDGAQTQAKHLDGEFLMMGNNPNIHGHAVIQQDNSGFGDTNHTYSYSVVYGMGGSGTGGFGTEYVQFFNMTYFNNLPATVPPADQGNLVNWYRDGADGSMGGLLINSVIAFVGSGNDDIYMDVDNEVYITNNWEFNANSEPSYLGSTDPLFMNTNALDFRLQSGSPLRGIGTHITTITNAGSGTVFGITDKHRLKGASWMREGDIISFPGGGTTEIISVDYDTHRVTVLDSITWTNNQRVYKGPRGYQADIGAYPYGAEFLTAASYTKSVNTYSVTPVGDAKGIMVYVDYIPVHWIWRKTNGVFTVTEAGNVTAIKAYPYYAQTNSVGVLATLGNDSPIPHRAKPGNNLRLRAR